MENNKLSDDDSVLFRQTIGQVKRIKHDQVLLSKDHPKPSPILTPRLQETTEYSIECLHAEDPLSFIRTGLQKNVLKKLQQGYFELEAGLDLHGLNSFDAQRYLIYFLADCVKEGNQCVHIIHGKGHRSTNRYPILKNNLNNWLRQHQEVDAFCSASAREGGTGAVFVLLRTHPI